MTARQTPSEAAAGERARLGAHEREQAQEALDAAGATGSMAQVSVRLLSLLLTIAEESGAVETGAVSRETQTVDKGTAAVNLRALLEVIAWAEGTAKQPRPYAVCYAYRHSIAGIDKVPGTIDDFRDHPTLTGEWLGEALPDAMCIAAGFKPGCVSTAAGKYQINKPTWLDVKPRLSLPDFSPRSQDRAAIELIRRCGALPAIEAGRLEEALRLCRRRWASLPGAGWGQPERPLEQLARVYVGQGGAVA